MCISNKFLSAQSATSSNPFLNTYFRPSLAEKLFLQGLNQLGNLVTCFPDSVLAKKIENLAKDELTLYQKNSKKWSDLGLNPLWFCNDPEGAQTLLSTRLIYSALGMQNTTEGSKHIRYNEAAKEIEILFQGRFSSIKKHIQHRFIYSKLGVSVQDKTTKENWFYFGKSGLLPVDQWRTKEFLPVTKLKKKELKRLKEHVQEKDKTVNWKEKTCFLQLVSDRSYLEGNTNTLKEFFTKNYKKNLFDHTWVRLITEDGDVYSIGLTAVLPDDYKNERLRKKRPFATNPESNIPIIDLNEFSPYKRRITNTFPISKEQSAAVLEIVKKERKKKEPFDRATYNCNQLSEKCMKIAGISFPIQELTLRDFFLLVLPGPFTWQKRLTTVINKYTPLPVKKIARLVWIVAKEIIERMVSFFFLNPTAVILGWNQNRTFLFRNRPSGYKPLKQRVYPFSNAFDLKAHVFSQLVIRQLEEKLTGNVFVSSYHGPNMCVVPRDKADPHWKDDLDAYKRTKAFYR